MTKFYSRVLSKQITIQETLPGNTQSVPKKTEIFYAKKYVLEKSKSCILNF